jgi:hypothetical protein
MPYRNIRAVPPSVQNCTEADSKLTPWQASSMTYAPWRNVVVETIVTLSTDPKRRWQVSAGGGMKGSGVCHFRIAELAAESQMIAISWQKRVEIASRENCGPILSFNLRMVV